MSQKTCSPFISAGILSNAFGPKRTYLRIKSNICQGIKLPLDLTLYVHRSTRSQKHDLGSHGTRSSTKEIYNIYSSTQYKNDISIKEKKIYDCTPLTSLAQQNIINHRAITSSSCCHLIHFNSSLNIFTVI